MTAVVARILTRPDQLREVGEPWRALAEARDNGFLTPEWLEALTAHLARERPIVAVAYRGSDVAGVLPLVARGPRAAPLVRLPAARLADHFHPACEPGAEAEVARAVGGALRRDVCRHAVLLLDCADDATHWTSALYAGFAGTSRRRAIRAVWRPYIEQPDRDWAAFLASRSANFRQQTGKKLRRLQREHDVRFRWAMGQSCSHQDVAAVDELHALRWATRGGSRLERPTASRIVHAFVRSCQERGWLRTMIMEIDGHPAAGLVGWRVGERTLLFKSGFDPRFAAASVGLLSYTEAVRQSLLEGAREVDMAEGDQSYKLRLATGVRRVETSAAAGPLSPGPAAIHAAVVVRRMLRGWRSPPPVAPGP